MLRDKKHDRMNREILTRIFEGTLQQRTPSLKGLPKKKKKKKKNQEGSSGSQLLVWLGAGL